jgi:hypothetical protein
MGINANVVGMNGSLRIGKKNQEFAQNVKVLIGINLEKNQNRVDDNIKNKILKNECFLLLL